MCKYGVGVILTKEILPQMKMRFHEALRLGSMTTRKARFTRHAEDGSKCALGAAEYAAGHNNWSRQAENIWPVLATCHEHPVTGQRMELAMMVATLNNGIIHRAGKEFEPWTREAIADFVQPIEEAWMKTQQHPEPQTTTEEIMKLVASHDS